MRDLIESWIEGFELLIMDNLISFFVFFTSILAEIEFLWAHGYEHSLAFTILLVACIANVLLCSHLEWKAETCKKEILFGRIYVIAFGALFVIGLFINFLAAIILFAIPFAVTFISCWIREFQDTIWMGDYPKIVKIINCFFEDGIGWVFSQLVILLLPLGTFIYFLHQTSMPVWLKWIITVAYIIISPCLAILEDSLSAKTVFELAYDFKYNKLEDESEEEI